MVRCFTCQQIGHYSTQCPRNAALYCDGERQRKKGGVQWKKRLQDQGVTRCGTICGTPVKDILLDTGSTRTLVKKDLVPRNRMVDGEVAIRCAHGNTIVYPLADVEIKIEGQCFTVQAGVSDTLPVSVLLGRDVPELLLLVSTGEDVLGREKTRMTRKQRRINSRQYARAEKKTDGSGSYDLDLTASELKQLQKADHTLVKENLGRARKRQKQWYDRNTQSRSFQPGDQVLVLLPILTRKLLAKWQGPYPVLRRVGRVNYEVDMADHRKRKRIFHVNMLRKWQR